MQPTKLDFKIGLFVSVGLVILVVLVISFSKGTSVFAETYRVHLRTSNVGSVIPGAKVLMAGVPIGRVDAIELVDAGRSVVMDLVIYQRYPIRQGASFFIQQSGFLGDQFVEVVPGEDEAPVLADGAEVMGEEPFSMQEAARSATEVIDEVNQVVSTVNRIVDRLDRTILSEGALANIQSTISNLELVSARAVEAVDDVHRLVDSHEPSILQTVTNLVSFSDRLEATSAEFQELITSNKVEFDVFLSHLRGAARELEGMASDVRSGKGLAGSLLYDDQVQAQFGLVVSNMTMLSSNLNRFGLLYKPKGALPLPMPGSRAFPTKHPFGP